MLNSFMKTIYISKKLSDENYDIPKTLLANPTTLDNQYELANFGSMVSSIKVITLMNNNIPFVINNGDLAYLDGVVPNKEYQYGTNANYYVFRVSEGILSTKIYFKRLQSGDSNVFRKE